MNIFAKFNRKSIDDRQIDTLIGLSKGLVADGKIVTSEAEVLLNWLAQSRLASDQPIIANLLERVDRMLRDGALDAEESEELFGILRQIAGNESELGELAKPSTLPLDTPPPYVTFAGNCFLFTGTFAYGERSACTRATEALGGRIAKSVTKDVDFLVVGSYVTESWAHESFGRKIEKAMQYREQGVPLKIIAEEHWATSGALK